MMITINNILCNSIDEISAVASPSFVDFVTEYYNEKDYVVAHTSGSTGTPKEILLNKDDMRASAKLTNSFFNLNSNSLFYLNLSPSYIAGKMMIVRALEINARIIEEPTSNCPLSNYQGDKVDLCAFVPSQLLYLLQNKDKLSLIKSMIIGGGKIPSSIHSEISNLQVNAYATYGMTETCSHIALAPITKNIEEPFIALGEVSFTKDNRGCLIINTPQFKVSQIITNDIIDLISETSFVWKGRYDNVINSGGIKVYPEEIELKIEQLFKNKRFFITSIDSEKWGEELLLVVEDKTANLEAEIKKIPHQLINQLKELLPSHSVPRKILTLQSFSETSTGKLLRHI